MAISGASDVDVERDSVGYYARDSSLSGDEEGEGGAFAIRVEQAPADIRFFRIAADYPSQHIGVPPTVVRFDVTQALLQSAISSPPNTLLCEPVTAREP